MVITLLYVVAFTGLCIVLCLISITDLRSFRIPNRHSLPLLCAGVVFALVSPELEVKDSLIGVGVGYSSLAMFGAIYYRLHGKDGLGLGDAKLFAAGGAWVGWQLLPVILLIASVSGLAWAGYCKCLSKPIDKVAFAPFLSLGMVLGFLWQFIMP